MPLITRVAIIEKGQYEAEMALDGHSTFKIMDVTADIGVIISSPTLERLYVDAAHALFEIMCDMRRVEPCTETEISVRGIDAPATMVNWLNELLYLFESEQLLFSDFNILSADPLHVRAIALGEEHDLARNEMLRHVKAVTFHRLKVIKTDKGWSAEILFDI